MRRLLYGFGWVGVLVVMVVVFIHIGVEAAAASPVVEADQKTNVLSVSPDMLYATGEGAMPRASEQPNRAKAYIQAKSYAKMQAIASLVQEVKGAIISYSSNGSGCVADTKIKEEIKGVLDCVQVVSARKRTEDTDVIVEVTVCAPKPVIPMAASQGVGIGTASAAPKPFIPTWVLAQSNSPAPDAPFTSLIINAQGMGVLRSMSPRILCSDGTEVWGTLKVDYDFISDYGVVAYAGSLADAFANKRAGDRPLVIRATARGTSASKSDVIIPPDCAQRVLQEDRVSGFLADFRVIFVVDPQAP